jgi:hypothetical protein
VTKIIANQSHCFSRQSYGNIFAEKLV